MRHRTIFGIFSHATHELWFGLLFVVLRAVVGLSILLFGISRIGDWTVLNDLSINSLASDWFEQIFAGSIYESYLIWAMIICGACIFLGMFTRISSIMLIAINIIVYMWMFDSSIILSREIVIITCCALFLSGGAGHAMGLDYFLYSYARERTWIVKLLFG